MKDDRKKSKGHSTGQPDDNLTVVRRELSRQGLSDAEIERTLRKKHRRRALEFGFVQSQRLMPAQPRTRGGDVCTVATAADLLQVHPKTVQRFIREGRLNAKRVGRSYRILRSDLEAFGGVPAPAGAVEEQARITAIAELPGVGPRQARKWTREVANAVRARSGTDGSLRADVVHDDERAALKVIIVGRPGDVIGLLGMIREWIEAPS